MKTILLTGATGFLGSSLAANFLARGARVIALSRNDADGSRTRGAIQAAARGFGIELSRAALENVEVYQCEFRKLEEELDPAVLEDVTEVWHCAAHMSYSPKKVEEALQQNLVVTTTLHELVRAHAPDCLRFYHVSTAYTAGIDGGWVPEALHFRPRLINAYQISKWSAEQALAHLAERSGLPVTIFRPSIIVGHRQTGWSAGKGFGYYMFVDALKKAAQLGIRKVTLDINPATLPNMIPVDEVVQAAMALSERRSEGPKVEVLHAANPHRRSAGEHLEIIGRCLGITVATGKPEMPWDQQFNEAVAWNREFASTNWEFEVEGMRREAGEEFCSSDLTAEEMERIVAEYLRGTDSSAAAGLKTAKASEEEAETTEAR